MHFVALPMRSEHLVSAATQRLRALEREAPMLRGLMDPHLSATVHIFPFRATPKFSLPWPEMMRDREHH